MFQNRPDGSYVVRAARAREFLTEQGVAPADMERIVSQASDFELTIDTKNQERSYNLKPLPELPSPAFVQLLSEQAAIVQSRQLAFGEWLGNHTWHLNLRGPTIDFGAGRQFPVQLLGAAAETLGVWRWGWAYESAPPPQNALTLARELEVIGLKREIAEFARPVFSLTRLNAYHVAHAAAGCFSQACYYRCLFDEGAVFVLVQELPRQIGFPSTPERIVQVIGGMLAFGALDHRSMLRAYLAAEGFMIEAAELRWSCRAPDGRTFQCVFDGSGHLSHYEASIALT